MARSQSLTDIILKHPLKVGLQTSDDDRFVRLNNEIPRNEWANNPIHRRWITFTKGGGYCKWFGQNWFCTDWQNEGSRMIAFDKSVLRNPTYYFLDGWSYSRISAGSLGFRRIDIPGCLGDKGPGVFFHSPHICAIAQSHTVSFMLRAISPQLAFEINTVLTAPIPGYSYDLLDRLSMIAEFHKRKLVSDDIIDRTFVCVLSARKYEAYSCWLHIIEGIIEELVCAAYNLSKEAVQIIISETGTPVGFHPLIVGYDALPELPVVPPSGGPAPTPPEGGTTMDITLPQEVVDYLAAHQRIALPPAELQRIKARLRKLYEDGPGAKEDEESAESDAGGEDDEGEGAVSGAHIPIPTETFLEELSVKMQLHPISVYWLLEELRREGARCKPEERRLLEDRLSVLVLRLLGHRWPKQIEAGESVPAWADPDGIIPISGGAGEHTLAERVRARLRAEDGDLGAQRAEALLAELTGLNLEEWLRREFFKRHVRQFKYRPIAWHLASDPSVAVADAKAKKRLGGRRSPAFECMLYYHACGGDVLARIRTQYVEPLLRGARQQLEHASQAKDDTGVLQANMRIQELEEFNRRLQHLAESGFASPELDKLLADEVLDRWSGDGYLAPADGEALLRQEQAWRVDLNDGVRVNIAPLQLAGLLASDVLKAADAKKALADRARWRSDERRWVRAGKLPRCGWMGEDVPESREWTRLAPQREAERAKLEEKRRAVVERREISA